jgi:hypothetical protein
MKVLRRGDSLKVRDDALVDRVTREVGCDAENLVVNHPFSDRVAEMGGIELDDCPGLSVCSPLPPELPEMESFVPAAWLEVGYARERAVFAFQGRRGTRARNEDNDAT